MDKAKITSNELAALVRCAIVAFTLRSESPDLFKEHTADIDKAADALVTIRTKLNHEQARQVFGDYTV